MTEPELERAIEGQRVIVRLALARRQEVLAELATEEMKLIDLERRLYRKRKKKNV